ncbi:unnamed protein product [Mytilus coruscus]|uniref:Uncharacterized protein n=1 Tax=Mytilus coruscus TaxID=42192 RepID=A0A6J8EP02_MYTCO|nr:unnamed protein product [Mytilus coruscus]
MGFKKSFLRSFSNAMNDRADIASKSDNSHEGIKQTTLMRDEEQVQAIVTHLNQTVTDPFDIDVHPHCLINISTDMHATREVQDFLLSAVNAGENMCRKFVNSAVSIGQSGNFYRPTIKSKLKTFTQTNAKRTLKCKSGQTITGHINPEIVFRCALALANSRYDVTIDSIFLLPLGPIPVSLFHEDRTMRKSCKSDLVKQFENEVTSVLSFPEFDPSLTTYVRIDMSIVQCMHANKHKTFGNLAVDYFNYCFSKAHTVADVFDRYDVKYSIKPIERERRTHQRHCSCKCVSSDRRKTCSRLEEISFC